MIKLTKICVIGPSCIDHTIRVSDHLSLDGSSKISLERQMPGGTGLCYAIALSRIGNSVDLFSRIGVDRNGKKLLSTFIAENIHPHVYQNKDKTDYAYILLDNGNHKVAVSRKSPFDFSQIQKKFIKNESNYDAIVITSLPNEVVNQILELLGQLEGQKPFVMWAPHLSNCREATKIQGNLGLLDHISLSQEEYNILKQTLSGNLSQLSSITVTKGFKGVDLIKGNAIISFPAYKILKNPLDTNGAGEAFGSGFISTFLLTKSYEKSISFGSYLAYLHIQRPGADFPRVDLKKLIDKQEEQATDSEFATVEAPR